MSLDEFFFIYCDAKGKVTARALGSISENDIYLQGICFETHKFRTFRKDRILETLDSSDELSERLHFHIEHGSKPEGYDISGHPKRGFARARKVGGVAEICFTGFGKAEKAELTDKAKKAGMIVRSSVAVFLDFLCCGKTAGPAKIEKARAQGVIALDSAQFCSLVEIGEIPI